MLIIWSLLIIIIISSNKWIISNIWNIITGILIFFSILLSIDSFYLEEKLGFSLSIFNNLFHIDIINTYFIIILIIFSYILLIPFYYTKQFKQKNSTAQPLIKELGVVIIFSIIGGILLIISSDLITIYLCIELQSFSLYLLASIYKTSKSSTTAGIIYFLLGALASSIILLGSGILYANNAIINIENISTLFSISINNIWLIQEYSSQLGLCVIGLGFLFKVSAAPLHQWAPQVYDGVPTKITAWLVVLPKLSIFIFLYYLTDLSNNLDININYNLVNYTILNDIKYTIMIISPWQNILLFISIISLIIGTILGLSQKKIKKLLAYSTISHVGFLLLALAIYSYESTKANLFYLVQYSVINLNLFLILILIGYIFIELKNNPFKNNKIWNNNPNKTDDLENIIDLKGIFNKYPLFTFTFALNLFSIAGVPPIVGFFGKYYILYSSIEQGYYIISLIAILISVVSTSYYLKLISNLHFYPNQFFNWENKNLLLNLNFSLNFKNLFIFNKYGKKDNNNIINFNNFNISNNIIYLIPFITLINVLFNLNDKFLYNIIEMITLSLFYV